MSNFCFFIFLIFFSYLAYGSDCASQFIDKAVHDFQQIQEDLKNPNKQRQSIALLKMRDIKPDKVTINNLIFPFLKSEDPSLRFSALQIITESIDMRPKIIGILLLHLQHENSNFIIQFINNELRDITPLDRKKFYQGKNIMDNIERLNVQFDKLNWWFTQLGILHPNDVNNWLDEVLKKNAKNRNIVERETFKLHQETQIITKALSWSLLNTPSKTYDELVDYVKIYMKYSGRHAYFNPDVNNWLHFFYLNFHKIKLQYPTQV